MSTVTREIPQDWWSAYMLDLNELYQGWRATIEVLGRAWGDQRAAAGLPLQGFSYETQGSEAGDILIEMGDLPLAFMIHHVDRPRALRVVETRPGLEIAIQIESEDGTTTLVLLRSPPSLPAGKDGAEAPSAR